MCSVTLLRGGGGNSWLTEAVLLGLRELRRRLGRVLPWSQLQTETNTINPLACPLQILCFESGEKKLCSFNNVT